MTTISWVLYNESQPEMRLQDAMLYARLNALLQENFTCHDWLHEASADHETWGPDPMEMSQSERDKRKALWSDPRLLDYMGAQLVDASEVDALMLAAGKEGRGVVLRNSHDPNHLMRYCSPGDQLHQHHSHIRLDTKPEQVIVHPNHELTWVRRFVVVDSEIIAATPYHWADSEGPVWLNHDWSDLGSEQFWQPLTTAPDGYNTLCRTEAERFLEHFALISGAIDVGMSKGPDGQMVAQIDDVLAARPGAFPLFYTDTALYAQKLVDKLHVLIPRKAAEDLAL